MVTEGEEKPFFSSSSYFMVAIAFQTSIAYAHAGKDRCNFFVVVPFASLQERWLSLKVVLPEWGQVYAF
jgi:hypothetical protein